MARYMQILSADFSRSAVRSSTSTIPSSGLTERIPTGRRTTAASKSSSHGPLRDQRFGRGADQRARRDPGRASRHGGGSRAQRTGPGGNCVGAGRAAAHRTASVGLWEKDGRIRLAAVEKGADHPTRSLCLLSRIILSPTGTANSPPLTRINTLPPFYIRGGLLKILYGLIGCLLISRMTSPGMSPALCPGRSNLLSPHLASLRPSPLAVS